MARVTVYSESRAAGLGAHRGLPTTYSTISEPCEDVLSLQLLLRNDHPLSLGRQPVTPGPQHPSKAVSHQRVPGLAVPASLLLPKFEASSEMHFRVRWEKLPPLPPPELTTYLTGLCTYRRQPARARTYSSERDRRGLCPQGAYVSGQRRQRQTRERPDSGKRCAEN